MKDFLSAGAARRLHLARLPAYAPDLNPAEGIWNLLKRRELKNRCCQDLDELDWELRLAIRRLQRRPRLLTACVAQGGYRLIPPQRSVLHCQLLDEAGRCAAPSSRHPSTRRVRGRTARSARRCSGR